MGEGFLSRSKNGTLVSLRVSPGARASTLSGTYGEGALKMRVAAPPVEGKANEAVCRYLAKLLGLPRSKVEVVRGACGRDKVALIRDMDPDEVRHILSTETG
ncbi:MAG TPA: DUF167 domain-containing protein [Rubrobacteraceae bacterium]|nr:DUF167 domain-containing protein [Rubrobacteraceae bacterium]